MSDKPHKSSSKITYKDAGVDIEAADSTVDWMKSELGSDQNTPHAQSVLSGVGGFSALFQPNFKDFEDPVLVSSTDGIGTKLLMGVESGLIEGLAQDLVAMCANDLLCVGAEPLFFLDYFASSKLNSEDLKLFFSQLRKSCHESNLALIGGETAELPGLYGKGHFDAAGFCVGVVDRKMMWSFENVERNEAVLFVESSGFHSNGYSLLRKLFGEDGGEFKNELMKPTHLYWPLIQELKEKEAKVKSSAHITGGGMDNLLRALPENTKASIKDWEWSSIVTEAQKRSQLSRTEMLNTFNCGVGLALVVEYESKNEIKGLIESLGFSVVTEGQLASCSEKSWELI